ncbi:leukocyte elastase inhibitor [Phymastichus coffea]|uniref:leukocyte elastase inhibitor n=1 Tax=Phymastichus coffea TaxID=108790 RepID=UPI00273C9EAA|nr:leukocyte elastase inhibitor [Phymastichus coffea]
MRLLVSLTLLAVASSTCRGQWIDPEQYDLLIQQAEDRRKAASKLHIPTFEPVAQSSNDIDNGCQDYLGSQQRQAEASAALKAPTQRITTTPSLNPFDTFLPPRWRDHVIKILSTGVTKFTLDMDRAIEKSQVSIPDSTLFSPVSLTTTLAMVMLASSGKTFEEVARILGLESGIDVSHHSEVVHRIFGLLLNQANEMSRLHPELPQSKFAFGIFVEDQFPVRNEFRDVSEKVYNSEVISVDFSHRSDEAQRIINDWVSNRTEGKIENMLQETPSPATDVIITSALYFNGEWDQHFFDGGTKKKPFIVNKNETIYVDMMVNGGEFPFYEDKKLGAKIIAFPYKGRGVSMYALLPTEEGTQGVKNLKSKLSPEAIQDLIGNMKNTSCIVTYPKMKLSSTLKLQRALEILGLKSLFDPRTADLSVLSPGRGGESTPSKLTTTPPTNAADPSPRSRFQGGFKQPVQNLYGDSFYFPSRIDARNLYRYEDRVGGYKVEQWSNGYRFEKSRGKRQTRPIDRQFIDFLDHQNLPTFGVDELRNTAGISNPGLYADDVIHKVEMTVNEKGTEAAAATSVVLDRSGDYQRFIANRPFLFFIRHDVAKSIWFWGTINRPAPHYNSL